MPSRFQILTRTSESSSTSRFTTAPTLFTAAGIAREQTVGDDRLDESLRFGQRLRARVDDGLALADPPARDRGRETDDRDRDDARERELAHLARHRPAAGRIRRLPGAAHPLLHTPDAAVSFGR